MFGYHPPDCIQSGAFGDREERGLWDGQRRSSQAFGDEIGESVNAKTIVWEKRVTAQTR